MKWLLDTRSLAVMRVGLGLILLFDAAHALYYLHYFYTELGFLPLSLLVKLNPPPTVSLFLLSRWWGFTAFLICLQGLAAVALVLGFRTRLATVLSWLLLLGLHQRNPFVLYGGDSWMLQTLFWCIFLPWGSRWSMDSREGSGETEVGGGAALGLLLQTALIYFLSGWEKLNPAWLEGHALKLFLQCGELRGGLGQQLLYYPELLAGTARTLPWLEMLAALCILLPVKSGLTRTVTLTGLAFFHIGLIPVVQLRTFSWVGVVVVLGLMPGVFWRLKPPARLARLLNRGSEASGSSVFQAPGWQWWLLILPLNTLMFSLGAPLGDLHSRFGALTGQRVQWALFADPPAEMAVLEIELELDNGRRIALDSRGKQRLLNFSWETAYHDLRFRQYEHNLAKSNNLRFLNGFATGLSHKIHRQGWESSPKTLHLFRRLYRLSPYFEEQPPQREEILIFEIPEESTYSSPPPKLPPAGG